MTDQAAAGSRAAINWQAMAMAAAVALAIFAFRGSLAELVQRWSAQEEYSHGFLIPLVSVWLIWSRRHAIAGIAWTPSYAGLFMIALSGALLVLGELSAMFILSQIGFVVCLAGIVLAAGGFGLLKLCGVPLVFLLFAIPLPYFLDSILSWRLQLMSSALGVAVIRFFGIPVYLEGNVIDLGVYKLQVVEACSGLRYLYPLVSLGFLTAYFMRAPLWQRAVVVLSTIPITIWMNSFRIGVIGITVDRWGIAAAEGTLHFFEGWIIFVACAVVLALEILVMSWLTTGRASLGVFQIPRYAAVGGAAAASQPPSRALMYGVIGLLLGLNAIALVVLNRQEVAMPRQSFAAFPMTLGPWDGETATLDYQIENFLGFDDYLLANFVKPSQQRVNLYVAYYASQRKGISPHSPRVCIPGGGWLITHFDRRLYPAGAAADYPYNRAVIEKGSSKQIVYYWFDQRGRRIANEWATKWYLLSDAIFLNRTDGALVRLTTLVAPGETESDADARLLGFISDLLPQLSTYLPG